MDPDVRATEAARARIAGTAITTPLIASPELGALVGRKVVLKLECLQVTGSFKLRGAANRILALGGPERERGVVACSSGNHGLATATVAAREGIRATICVPEWVDPEKLGAIRDTGAEVVVEGATAEDSEQISLQLQRERDLTYVHPFDDPLVIAGQGTIGHEILEQAPEVDTILVPTSGGGLVSGIATAVKGIDGRVGVHGVLAARAPVLARSVEQRGLVSLPEEPTIATALAGNLGPANHHTLRIVTELVDSLLEVPEHRILEAMRFAYRRHRLVVEGGGAVGIGAVLDGQAPAAGGALAVVVSGGNIDLAKLREVLSAT